ncbi:MAG: tripartite tricarboxylate transporter substrate binding protein [Thermodesulfobacteriota bacterium]
MLKRNQNRVGVIFSVLFILVLILTAGAVCVQAQDKYPSRAIDIIVPYAPGGATDVTARQIANFMKSKWGVPVNILSKPGGRGIPALLELYQATPDGYTMLAEDTASSSMLAAATANTKDLPFNTMDRTFIATVKAHPFVLFVPATSPYKTLDDFIAAAKSNIKDISYTAGPSALEYAVRQLFSETGLNIAMAKAVMCKGASEAVLLAAGGHVTVGAAALGTTLPAIKSDTIRPLIITSKKRWPDLPNLPSSSELGYPGINASHWVGISGPPKLPANVANVWDKALKEMIESQEFISQLKNTGAVSFYQNSQETVDYVKGETDKAIKLFK